MQKLARLKKFRFLLSNFKNLSKHEKKIIVNNLTDEVVKLIVEIIGNVENGCIKIDSKSKTALKKYKKSFVDLLKRENTLQTQKRIIQKGGFVAPLLSVLGTQLLSYLLNKL